MINTFDITLVVTAHNESVIAGPPIRSAQAAIAAAREAGYTVQQMIGLDSPTLECQEFFRQRQFKDWEKFEFEFADPYPTRNALVRRAGGRWIAFQDADDLLSENWLVRAAETMEKAEKDGQRVIAHPELNWVFDSSASVFTKPSQDDPLFTPYFFYFNNFYDMMGMAPRKAHVEIPYVHRDIPNGFGYADWQWSIETMEAGWRHVSVKDTIIFKRRRDWSVVLQNSARQAIIHEVEAMAIDKVRNLAK